VFCAYFFLGLLLGLLLCIFFGSIICVESVIPVWCLVMPDMACIISGVNEHDCSESDLSLVYCNNQIEETARYAGIPSKKIFEVQGCVEELFLRVKKARPDAVLYLTVRYGNSISLRFTFKGKYFNPFRVNKNDDMLDVASLKLLRHKAIRASSRYRRSDKMTHIHIVI
jgi:hypothetical protein